MKHIKRIGLLAVGDETWQGGIQYITNIIYALDAVARNNDIEVFLIKNNEQFFPAFELQNIKLSVVSINESLPPFSMHNRMLWFLQRKLSGRINPRYENFFLRHQIDFVFPGLFSDCGGRLNSAGWIADFQYHYFPEGHGTEASKQAEQVISRIANQAKKIVFSSRFCEQDAYRLFPQTKGKSFVMPFAVHLNAADFKQSPEMVREKYQIDVPYIMVSNLFAPTKNHKTLFEALGILRKKGLVIPCVCTGNFVNYQRMSFTNEVLQMISENGIRHQLYILGLIPRQDQVALYRMAVALVQPSVNEGWSTLVEEAKAMGKKILLSDIEVHREQYPDNPWMFKALDAMDLATKLEVVWHESHKQETPDMDLEQKSISAYAQHVKLFGTQFLQIAQAN